MKTGVMTREAPRDTVSDSQDPGPALLVYPAN